jgi:hypothetical protein
MKRSKVQPGTPQLFSTPSLLRSESLDDFETFNDELKKTLWPRDFIEEMYVADILRYEWEIIRLNRAKTEIIKLTYPEAIQSLLRKLSPSLGPSLNGIIDEAPLEPEHGAREELALDWSANRGAQRTIRTFLKRFKLDDHAIEAEAIILSMTSLEKLEAMVSVLQRGRDRAFQALHCYRASYAASVRKTINEITDDEAGNVRRLEMPPKR